MPKGQYFICEDHFWSEDIKKHGDTKRLTEGAVPVFFPREEAMAADHTYAYVETTPVDLVCKFYLCRNCSW